MIPGLCNGSMYFFMVENMARGSTCYWVKWVVQ